MLNDNDRALLVELSSSNPNHLSAGRTVTGGTSTSLLCRPRTGPHVAGRKESAMSETHWRKVIRRKNEHLLFAEDIGPTGSKVDVEIADSGVFKVTGADGKSDDLPWIAFAGKKKRLALNATNCKTMQSVTGTGIVEKWRGPITLVVITTTFKDRKTKEMITTDAIRIAPQRPAGKRSSAAQPDLTDQIREQMDASQGGES